jgi:peptidyl-prolyl cis-trans isomerase B (cyclophilin B)
MKIRRMVTTASACAAIALTGLTAASAVGTTSARPQPTLGHAPRLVRTAQTTADDPCGYTAAIPADRFKGIPTYDATAAARPYSATLYTTQGLITFRTLTAQAPCTTFSFRFLASHGYYNVTHCHRLTLQRIFVLQCGDPTGTGSGGPGYSFNDENLAGATYPAGTVAMANAGPNTNGSQFFITWKDTQLSPAYTPFGVVTGGMSVLAKIAAAGDDSQNSPGDGYPNAYVGIALVGIRFTA